MALRLALWLEKEACQQTKGTMKAMFEAKLAAALLARGWKEEERRSKYRVFSKLGFVTKRFVGKSGALRAGECVSKSFSIGDPQRIESPSCSDYKLLVEEGTVLLEGQSGKVKEFCI